MREARSIMVDLASSGLTAEQLALVMELSASLATEARPVVDEAAERRRAKDRDYQAGKRRQKSADSPDSSGQSPPNDIYSNPPSTPVEAKASTAPRGRSDRGSKIPESWTPPPIAELPAEARAMAEKWPAAAYRAEAEAFLNYWLGESSGKARKSNWNRAWCNRIVAVNGKVMREAKFAAPANIVGKAPNRPMNSGELKRAIAFAENQNDFDRLAELKSQLERLTARPPPGPVGEMVGRIRMRVGGNHG